MDAQDMDRSGTQARFARLALGLTIGLAPAGCVQRRTGVERRDLEARVTGAGHEAGQGPTRPEADPSVERASAEDRDGAAEGPEAAAIPSEPLSLEKARAIALRSSPVLAQS